MRPLNWRAILLWTALGTFGGVTLCLFNLWSTEDALGGFVAAVPGTPLADQQRADGLREQPAGGGHDGSQFYAIAHDPLHPQSVAERLDRPRYRLQRILFPTVAWMLHPTGGGQALVWTMFGVLVAGMVLGGIATGGLANSLGGPPWPAATFGVLPGTILALRISTPDALALALALTAILLSLKRRPVLATLIAVAAVLTREPLLLTFAAFALWRRDREGIALVVIPGAVAAAWWLWLAATVGGPLGVSEFVPPLFGWRESVSFWLQNPEGSPLGVLAVIGGLALAAFALTKTTRDHPLWFAIAINLVVLCFYSASVLAPERNATRVFLPTYILSIIALTTKKAGHRVLQPPKAKAATGA